MYLEFLQSTSGQLILVVAAVLTVCVLLFWAHGHAERVLMLGTATVLTAVLGGVYVLALAAQWWAGEFFETPPIAQAALLIPISLAGLTVWLASYQWLTERTGQALHIYIAISLLLALAVAIAHRFNLGQGTILVGPDWSVLYQAIFAELLAWIPVIVFEWLRRTLERSELIP